MCVCVCVSLSLSLSLLFVTDVNLTETINPFFSPSGFALYCELSGRTSLLILCVRVRAALTESQPACGIAIALFFRAIFKEGIRLSTHCLLLLKSSSGSCFYLVVVVPVSYTHLTLPTMAVV